MAHYKLEVLTENDHFLFGEIGGKVALRKYEVLTENDHFFVFREGEVNWYFEIQSPT